jgi:hypothetical protein
MTRRTWVGLAPTALGLVVVLAYLNFATNALSLPERLTLIFYSLGLFLVSVAMMRASRFAMVLGIYGAVVSAGLLVLNMATFPIPPAEADLVDLGPLTGLWWLVLILGGITGRRLWRVREGTV